MNIAEVNSTTWGPPRTVKAILGGGLGNQLFMYSAGRALAMRIGARLLLDTSQFRFDHMFQRVYLLDRLPIKADLIPDSVAARVRRHFDRVVRRVPTIAKRWGLWDEPVHDGYGDYDPRLLEPGHVPSVSLRGYWQSERYFQDFSDTIRREVFPPPPSDPIALQELARIKNSADPIAIGIRFYGDIPGRRVNPVEVVAAFRQCLASQTYDRPHADYFVFTDMPSQLFDRSCLGVPFTLISHRPRNEDALIDLHLMASCRTFFIGYSSFHWWGAWLSPNIGKQVTYLRFSGRPGPGYAACGWKTLDA